MAAPHRFLRKLHDVIGAEATDAMAEWMNGTDEKLDELRADIAELRQEMDAKISNVNAKLVETREELRVGFANVEAAAARRHADFMKWTMGFWAFSLVTYVGAVVALAMVLP